MSTEPFLGEIKLLGFNFAPKGYISCSGQLLPISQNAALFSLLGTYYGGDGRTTFALPNLNGRVPIGQDLTTGRYVMGQAAGSPNVTLLLTNLPMHNHVAGSPNMQVRVPSATSGEGSGSSGAYLGPATFDLYGPASGTKFLGPDLVSGVTGVSGSNMPTPVQQPYLVVNYSIATQGIFPSRN